MKHPIPDAALDDRLAFVGTAGSGKTYNAGSGVERLLERKARVIIADPLGVWYGLRLMADGKRESPFSVVVFGGPHGDIGINEHAGALIGETVAGMAESCILDLSQIGTKAGERRFMLAFLTALYRRASGEPVHLVVDEADMFAPQRLLDKDGEAAKLLGMMETIVRRGRVKGFIPWLISQRPAVLSKDVLSQADGMIAFKLTASQDRDAIGAWIEGQADKQQGKEILASLPSMQRGQGIVWVPGRGILENASFPQKQTFDSSRTPKRGETVRARSLKPIDLGALKDRLAAVETEAKANDPKALRATIARLEREAAVKPTAPAADPEAIAGAHQDGMAAGFDQGWAAGVKALSDMWLPYIDTIQSALPKAMPYPPRPNNAPPANHAVAPPRQQMPVIRTPLRPRANGADTSELPKGERACLIAIAMHPNGVTREQVTILTGYKRSTRDAYIQRLAERGFCEQQTGHIHATDAGVNALGDSYEPLPTGAALRTYWLQRLPEGERAVLSVAVEEYPHSIGRDIVGDRTGYKRSTRDAYIQRLSTRQLISAERGSITASTNLF